MTVVVCEVEKKFEYESSYFKGFVSSKKGNDTEKQWKDVCFALLCKEEKMSLCSWLSAGVNGLKYKTYEEIIFHFP